MHGRPRDYKRKLQEPKAQEGHRKKVDAIRNGTALVLECRRQRKYDAAVMDASAKLLKVVPEIYTLWNFRREALEAVFSPGNGGDEARRASEAELALTFACLQENPKSYSAWHHRKWVVRKGLTDLGQELKLISKALDDDSRNFHAWNYRQFVVGLMGRPSEDELQYCEDKVAQDFSNYSAWHWRTMHLHQIHRQGAGADSGGAPAASQPAPAPAPALGVGAFLGSAAQVGPIPLEVLDQEYDMVHQAFATDSGDQSPWFYYRWLVGNTLACLPRPRHKGGSDGQCAEEAGPPGGGGEGGGGSGRCDAGAPEGEEDVAARAQVAAVLEREVARLQEDHLAADPDAKWPLLTLARLKEAQARTGLVPGAGGDANAASASPGPGQALLEEARGIYRRLMALDPMRRGYYEDALEGRAFVVVQALGTV